MNKTGIIYGINGPVIYLKGDSGFKISEMVYVGKDHLVGEVIGLKKGMTTIQVFEETTGLRPGETVIGTGDAISVLLGPGIIPNYCKRRRCRRSGHGHCRNTGNRFYSPQIHGTAEYCRRYRN